MWFDGANGGDGYYGGANDRRSIDNTVYYDIPNLRDSVHKVCPDCVMWGVGGEARWIGNEAGWAGETNWSPENRGFAPEKNGMYGSEDGWYWLPGESDAKATNKGWFYHDGESPRTAEQLFTFYLETVGRNATLILNFPPDKSGSLPEATVNVMHELGGLLKQRLGRDLAKKAKIEVSEVRTKGKRRSYVPKNMNDGDKDTYWATNDSTRTATVILTWRKPINAHYVALQEYIRKGQRIRAFRVETTADGTEWTVRAPGVECTTVGYKRIIPLNGSTKEYGDGYAIKGLRITILDSKACPLLHTVSVY